MPPDPQIRLFAAHPDDNNTRLLTTQSVTILLIDPPHPLSLPPAPPLTIAHDVPLCNLLDPHFLSANDPSAKSHGPVSAVTLPSRPSSHLTATLTSSALAITIPTPTVPQLGLTLTKLPSHLRNHHLPALACVAPNTSARARWALAPDRVGRVDLALSAGPALVRPPRDASRVQRGRAQLQVRESTTSQILDAASILRDGDGMEIATLVDTIQLLTVGDFDFAQSTEDGDNVDFEHLPTLSGERRMCIAKYVGFCNASLAAQAVQTVREAVRNGASWGAVLARAPPAGVAWKTGLPRGGDPGFNLDAAEIVMVAEGHAYVAQLRAPCDAV